jgi:chemotaxis protein CheZ
MTEEAIIVQLTDCVSERVTSVIRESLSDIVQQEISKALSKALVEGQFYRTLNSEVIDGIENIYTEIKAVKRNVSAGLSHDSISALMESDTILDDIMRMTEKATLTILERLEEMQEGLRQAISMMGAGDYSSSKSKLEHMDRKIFDIMTELSFQDLTGQQIKRVIESLKKVEDIVFNVYVTSEIMKKSKEQSPDRDVNEIKEEAKDLASSARSKKGMIDQGGVDNLLAQLGL